MPDASPAEVLDRRDCLLLPGLVDTHVHFPQISVIGTVGLQLLDWLRQGMLPEEARMADAVYARRVLHGGDARRLPRAARRGADRAVHQPRQREPRRNRLRPRPVSGGTRLQRHLRARRPAARVLGPRPQRARLRRRAGPARDVAGGGRALPVLQRLPGLYLATAAGAEAIGLGDTCGDLTPGKQADLVLRKAPTGSTLEALLEEAPDSNAALGTVFTLAREESVVEVRVGGDVVFARGAVPG